MFKAIKEFFFGKPVEQSAAPYKVEAPVSTVVIDASLDSKPQVATVAPVNKPRANVAAKKIAAAKKPAAPRKPKAPTA